MIETQKIHKIFRDFETEIVVDLILLVVGTILLIFLVQKLFPWLARHFHGQVRLNILAVTPILRLFIIIVSIATAVPMVVEPTLQNMITLFGALGVGIGFALKDYVSSLIAGIVVIIEKPFRNGDWITNDGVYGEVCEVGVRSVRMITPDDNKVTIPHSRLWTYHISNANDGAPRLMCVADFYLHPNHDGILVREKLHDVAVTSPYLYFDKPIAVIVQEKPWGTHYKLKAYTVDSGQQFHFITDLTLRAKKVLRDLGVEFVTAPVLTGKAQANG